MKKQILTLSAFIFLLSVSLLSLNSSSGAQSGFNAKWLNTETTLSGVAKLRIEASNYTDKIQSANFPVLEEGYIRLADLTGQDGAGKTSQIIEYNLDTTKFTNGQYTLKAWVFDSAFHQAFATTPNGEVLYKVQFYNAPPDNPPACKVDLVKVNKVTSRIIGRHEGRIGNGSAILDSLQKYYKDHNLNVDGYKELVKESQAKLLEAQKPLKTRLP